MYMKRITINKINFGSWWSDIVNAKRVGKEEIVLNYYCSKSPKIKLILLIFLAGVASKWTINWKGLKAR